MISDSVLAWGCYLLSALALLFVLWRLLGWMGFRDVRLVATVIAAAFLFTPVPVEEGATEWAPAFMAALIDLVTVSSQAAIARLWPILIAMLIAVLLSFTWRVYLYKNKKPANDSQ